MNGIIPKVGVPPRDPRVAGGPQVSYAPTQPPVGGIGVLYHKELKCAPPDDRVAWNWLEANLLRMADEACVPLDGNSFENLMQIVASMAIPVSTSIRNYNVAGTYVYIKPDRLRAVNVRLFGAGASGASRTDMNYGGAGGAGSYMECDFLASELPPQMDIIIGRGGTAIPSNLAASGVAGGQSSFFGLIAGGGDPGTSDMIGGLGGRPQVAAVIANRAVVFGGINGQNGTDPQNTPGPLNLGGFGGRGGNNQFDSVVGGDGICLIKEYYTLCNS